MAAYKFAFVCAFLPLISVHVTLLTSISVGNISPCLPYWADCHSISATGRQAPEFFIFKALMIPAAVFKVFYWLLLQRWMQKIHPNAGNLKIMTCLGIIASIALILYTVTLGALGEPYAFARRVGVVLYFAFTAFAHLLLLRYLDNANMQNQLLTTFQNRLIITCTLLIATAIFSAFLGLYWDGWERWENAYEWWFAVFMISMFYQVGCMWKVTAYKISASLKPSSEL